LSDVHLSSSLGRRRLSINSAHKCACYPSVVNRLRLLLDICHSQDALLRQTPNNRDRTVRLNLCQWHIVGLENSLRYKLSNQILRVHGCCCCHKVIEAGVHECSFNVSIRNTGADEKLCCKVRRVFGIYETLDVWGRPYEAECCLAGCGIACLS